MIRFHINVCGSGKTYRTCYTNNCTYTQFTFNLNLVHMGVLFDNYAHILGGGGGGGGGPLIDENII